MDSLSGIMERYIGTFFFPRIQIIDIIEILLIAFFVYQFMLWIRSTRAYSLLKGILIIFVFVLIAIPFIILNRV